MMVKMHLVSVGLWGWATVQAARHGMQAFESIRAAPEGWKVDGAPDPGARLNFRIALVPVSATPATEAISYTLWGSGIFDAYRSLPFSQEVDVRA